MKKMIYPKLAAEGMKNNRRLYIPYMLTCILMISMFYIISFLSESKVVRNMHGGNSTQQIMSIGGFVIIIFAFIFLIYTNSFLIKIRNKEFGLYNVLGMNKWNLSKILIWETIMIYAISMISGLLIGILFSKIAELILLNIGNETIEYGFYIDFKSIVSTTVLYSAIFALLLLNTLRKIVFLDPIEMVRSDREGEKQPKANLIPGLLGILLLAAAYAMAVSIKNPITALILFFAAVIMVIIGTYLIFISGSVLLCRLLQKNKSYYYKKNHFVSVSSMMYRMRRNGAGLASICILLTMVFVTIAGSSCLYFGAEDTIRSQYPRELTIYVSHYGYSEEDILDYAYLKQITDRKADELKIEKSNVIEYMDYNIFGIYNNGELNVHAEETSVLSPMTDYDHLTEVSFMSQSDYNRMTGSSISLNPGEALAASSTIRNIAPALSIDDLDYQITGVVSGAEFDEVDMLNGSTVSILYVIVPNLDEVGRELSNITDATGESSVMSRWFYYFDTDTIDETDIAFSHEVYDELYKHLNEKETNFRLYSESREAQRADFFGSFGGIFFIGILLSVIFILAAVLIIYYKQTTEGYEDQKGFAIMRKIGMTAKDIKATVNSQMRTVFYMPIIIAALHMAFAFPCINKLLMLFSMFNEKLFVITTIATVVLAAGIYTIVYKITSGAYYRIVTSSLE